MITKMQFVINLLAFVIKKSIFDTVLRFIMNERYHESLARSA